MQGDFIEKEDSRPISGYGTALLVDEHNDGYYSLVIPLESVPTVYGDEDTFEYDILISKAKGSVKGKMSLDSVTTDYLLTRENNYRLSQLENKQLSYMVFHNNFTGYTFTGQLSYRDNDAEADILKGTISITPTSIGGKFYDGRKKVRQTLDFAGSLPDKVTLGLENTGDANAIKINLAVAQADASATFAPDVKGENDYIKAEMDSANPGLLKIYIQPQTGESAVPSHLYGMVFVTANSNVKMEGDNAANKYAPWTMTIAVEYKS